MAPLSAIQARDHWWKQANLPLHNKLAELVVERPGFLLYGPNSLVPGWWNWQTRQT